MMVVYNIVGEYLWYVDGNHRILMNYGILMVILVY